MIRLIFSALLLFGVERGLDSLPEEVDAEIHAPAPAADPSETLIVGDSL